MNYDYDVIVIGSGPGGEGASMQAAKAGQRVAVVDDFPQVGGSCTHRATIPSKALRQAIQQLEETRDFRRADYSKLLESAASIISQQVSLRRSFYERNQVDVLHGWA